MSDASDVSVQRSAVGRAMDALSKMYASEEIDRELFLFGLAVVKDWDPDNTVYMDIQPIDDSDLSFYVVGGDDKIYLDLYSTTDGYPDGPDEDWYLSYRIGGWEGTITGPRKAFPYQLFNYVVEQFSARVNVVNPNWRDLYE